MERAGLHEVAADAAVSSVDVQVGLIQALDGVRDCIGETFTELAGALDRDIDADALNDAAAHLSTAGEDVLGLLDVLDPERDAAHRH
ncbi:hypothetical protein [Lentzea sp. NPDC092896]|uniref:hypothetical protein n=1 Tax=Lentzea sp. NPDC092896 TaxID=3364127 RepID=UPI0037FB8511